MVMNLFHIFLHCNVINVWGKNHDNKTVLILLFPKAEHNNTMLKKKKRERQRDGRLQRHNRGQSVRRLGATIPDSLHTNSNVKVSCDH